MGERPWVSGVRGWGGLGPVREFLQEGGDLAAIRGASSAAGAELSRCWRWFDRGVKAPNFWCVETSIQVVIDIRKLALVLGLAALQACGPKAGGGVTKLKPDDPGFYDYTTTEVRSVAEFQQLAAVPPNAEDRPAVAGAKFVITSFGQPSARRIHFLDGRYYRFHDEWAWFRLLNGQQVVGMEPLERRPFAAPGDARSWALAHEEDLPERLEINDGRLYVREFYDLSLSGSARPFGAGSLIHVEPRPPLRPEIWGFEVDYSDPVDLPALRVFFDELERTIPQSARQGLKWIARSPEQLEVGKRLMASDAKYQGRVMTYADVSIPGETAVYTSGIVAGKLRAFRELSRLAEAEPEDILLLGALPEYLPQARGLVTAIPQTPLAHLNLLAKSRQIVNAYRGGVLDDPDVQDLVRSRAPVVLVAENGRMRFKRITEQQYQGWLASTSFAPPVVAAVDVSKAPYLVDLSRVELKELPRLAPLIGGKGVGMVHLLRSLGPGTKLNRVGTLQADVPDRPLVLSIRAYREHLAPLLPELKALLADESFLKFKKLRFLALEGVKEFSSKFPSKKDRELGKSYEHPRAVGAIAAVVRQGGVRYMVRHASLPAAVKAELTGAVVSHFAGYSPEQGLRFRSSSTVEDIEGFNGAGLYDSATGYVMPRKASGSLKKRDSMGDAVRKTWASYFSFEAFEERHQNHIEHLAADMGVLIHARFDDEHENANGVFTFTVSTHGNELSVDAQPGAVSVTNPPTDRVVIPESTQVRQAGVGLEIKRQTLSSLAKAGQQVMSDQELSELYWLGQQLTLAHLAVDNSGVPPEQRRLTLVMDFEFRRVTPGWPALKQGTSAPRFVVKQMRPLEPSPRVSAALKAAPIPHDVLARARRIENRHCRGAGLELDVLSVLTDPNASPDVGHSKLPLVAGIGVTLRGAEPRVFTHLDLTTARLEGGNLEAKLGAALPFTRINLKGTTAELTTQTGAQVLREVQCETSLDYAEPRELLRSFLE